MGNEFILTYSENNRMNNIEESMNIYHLLRQVILLKIPGEVIELGCNKGYTAMLLQKTLEELNSHKKLHLFDSFQGLPAKTKEDKGTTMEKGFCKAKKSSLIENFKKNNLNLPIIHEGWFKDTLKELSNKISFVHLDADFYLSTKESLEAIYSKLSKGAIVVIDDYYDKSHKYIEEKLNSNIRNLGERKYNIKEIAPGVKKACDKFFKNKEKLYVLIAGDDCHAYFIKE